MSICLLAPFFDMRRNHKGMAHQLVPVLVSALFFACFLVIAGDILSVVRKRDEINQIARHYLLIMETKGYLPVLESTELVRDLEAVGVTQVSLAGTSMEAVDYGSTIVLDISCLLQEEIEVLSQWEAVESIWELRIDFTMVSTAKH